MANPFTTYKQKAVTEVQAANVTMGNVNDLAIQLRGKVVVEGQLSQTTLVIPTLEGDLRIPVGEYVTFDPLTGKVEHLNTDEFLSRWEEKK